VKGYHTRGTTYLEFLDSKGETIYDYDPDNAKDCEHWGCPNSGNILEVKIEENQELIGVYGNNDSNYLGSLGFIVKEKKQK